MRRQDNRRTRASECGKVWEGQKEEAVEMRECGGFSGVDGGV